MVDRRAFLRMSAVAGAGVPAPQHLRSALAQPTPVAKFHAPKPMMVGLNAFSFSRMLNAFVKNRRGDKMTLPELLEYCADPLHRFDAVDITGYYFPNYSATEAGGTSGDRLSLNASKGIECRLR